MRAGHAGPSRCNAGIVQCNLNDQETFTIHGPQLEVLGEVESKLPAPAKKRSTASVVLVALVLVSVFGIGGAKLKGKYNDTAKLYTAIDKYNNSIQTDWHPGGRGG